MSLCLINSDIILTQVKHLIFLKQNSSKQIFRILHHVAVSIAMQLSKLVCKKITAFVRGEKQQTHNHLNFGQTSEMEANIAMKSQ